MRWHPTPLPMHAVNAQKPLDIPQILPIDLSKKRPTDGAREFAYRVRLRQTTAQFVTFAINLL